MKIQKLTVTVLTAVLFLFCLSGCNSDPNAPAGMITASGDAADYLFFVPDDWTVDMSTGATSAYCSANDPSSVSVMSWNLPNTDTTLDDWWDINMNDISMVFRNVTLESTEDTTLDGVYAQSYTYTAELGEYTYKIQQTAAIRNGNVYLVTFTSMIHTFDQHMDALAGMLSFFRFR